MRDIEFWKEYWYACILQDVESFIWIRILDKSPVSNLDQKVVLKKLKKTRFKTASRPDWPNHFNRLRSSKKLEDDTDGKINGPFIPLTCLWRSKGHLLQGNSHLYFARETTTSLKSCKVLFMCSISFLVFFLVFFVLVLVFFFHFPYKTCWFLGYWNISVYILYQWKNFN